MHLDPRKPLKVDLTSELFATALGLLLLALPVYCLWPLVQWAIGQGFDRGDYFLRQDARRAAAWYQRSIEPRSLQLVVELAAPAYRLAWMHDEGIGVPQDPKRARELLQLAAERGLAGAQNDLYVALARQDSPTDWPEALVWLQRAVAANDPSALCNLGALHASGAPGVLHDPVEARALYERAHRQNSAVCVRRLSQALDQGLGGAADAVRARAILLDAAKAQQRDAMHDLGLMMLAGRGGPADAEAGRRWLRQGAWTQALAEQGDSEARYEVARGAYLGGFAADPAGGPARALALLQQAADSGIVPAMTLLAEFHELGVGTATDLRQAERWHERASQAGGADSTVWLAEHAARMQRPPAWLAELAARLEKAARGGHARAQLQLAAMHRRGLGLPVDPVQASAWLSVAAAMHSSNTEADKERELLGRSLSASQLAQAQTQARAIWADLARSRTVGAP